MGATFLTGDRQVGKSVIIGRFLQQTGLSADGFVTSWQDDADGERGLYLAPYGATGGHLLARWDGAAARPVPDIAEVFDTAGTAILDGSGAGDVIVMDELGRLESAALAFQRAVLARLDGPVPVLGVVRDAQTPFLDAVRVRARVIRVHETNRDAVVRQLIEGGL